MSTPDYTQIGTPVETTQWDTNLQRSVEGFKLYVRDSLTGGVFTVFVPKANANAQATDDLIRYALTNYRSVATATGTSPPSAAA